MRAPTESVGLYVQRVANVLGVTHEGLGKLVARSQPTISQIVNGDRAQIDPLIERRLDEVLANHVVLRELHTKFFDRRRDFCVVVLNRLILKEEMTVADFLDHLPRCPACLLYAVQYILPEADVAGQLLTIPAQADKLG